MVFFGGVVICSFSSFFALFVNCANCYCIYQEKTACLMIWPDGDPSESLMDHLYQVELKVFITITITITMMIIITSIIIGCIITIVNLYSIYGQRFVNITFWY